MKITGLLIWAGTIASAGSFGYKMIQKSRGRNVPYFVDTLMYAGIGSVAVGVAMNVATGGKAPVKLPV